jgi:hydroxymethylglutaryl-CoA synthase
MSAVRGITGYGAYLPYRRLDLQEVAGVAGGGGRKGQRTVASFDEDATTMAVEAARNAIRSAQSAGAVDVRSVWFCTVAPPYLDRTNANTVHAALRLDRSIPAYDVLGSVRSAFGALRAAMSSEGTALAVASDLRSGLPGGPDEAYFGDGAGAILVGDDTNGGAVVAEVLSWASVSGDVRSKVWEERFGEEHYTVAARQTLEDALDRAGLTLAEIDRFLVTGTHGRAVRTVAGRTGAKVDPSLDELSSRAGVLGAAHPYVVLTAALEKAAPGEVIALVGLADGAETLLLRTTDAIAGHRQVRTDGTDRTARTVDAQLDAGAPVSYGRYLSWRNLLPVEPPRRPEPARVSATAAGRSVDWKFGLVGSRSGEGEVSMPPAIGDPERSPMADVVGTVKTFTVDRLSYTPSPPLVFAVVDFDGGGRLPVELTDVDATDVQVGDRVEMVFRRLSTADGIHNYFWKGRPLRGRST